MARSSWDPSFHRSVNRSRSHSWNRREFCLGATALSLAAAAGSVAHAAGSHGAGPADGSPRLLLGVDYYPDQTPEHLWAEDARMMAEAGITNVRLAEFAWALMEPSEGTFQFDWLHRAVDLLHAQGIACILGTPSAAPPQWLSAKYPEVLMVNENSVTLSPDGRRYTCPTNAKYRELSCAIASRMADAFANAPAVIGWQIDNEFTLASFARCYCQSCRAGFQKWCQSRYGSLDALNAAWGTSFWSQVYTDWTQIPVPFASGGPPNPGFALDYDRYESDAMAEFSNLQVAILREKCPKHFLTTNNVAGLVDKINLHTLAEKLDFMCADNYPGFFAMHFGGAPDTVLAPTVAFSLDAMRAMKDGKPFLVMEEQSGKAGQPYFCPQPRRGQVRLWSYQAVARGAMGVNYFRWDTATFGAEEYWHGMLQHDRSKSPAFDEIVRTIAELKKLGGEMLHAPVVSKIAVMFDSDSDWAVEIQPGQEKMRYSTEVTAWYSALWAVNYGLSLVTPEADLSQYRLLLLPLQYVLSEALARKIEAFAHAGGVVVVGYRSGEKNEKNQVVQVPRPGLLGAMCGVTVFDYVPMYGDPQSVQFSGQLAGADAAAETWYDVLELHGASALATYTRGDYAGRPAVTVHHFGSGRVYYLGAHLDAAATHRVLGTIAESCGAKAPATAPAGVELTMRAAGGKTWLFAMNHNDTSQTLTLPAAHRELLTGHSGTTVSLEPFGVAVLQPA